MTDTREEKTNVEYKGMQPYVVEVAHDRLVRRHGEGRGGVVLSGLAVKSGEHLRRSRIQPHPRTATPHGSELPARAALWGGSVGLPARNQAQDSPLELRAASEHAAQPAASTG